MSNRSLPERPSLEYLKKLAKDRLRGLRLAGPGAKLAAAQLAVAREHGFPSWRALKAEVQRRQAPDVARFFELCAAGDAGELAGLLAADPGLAQATSPTAPHAGWTPLHEAARRGRPEVVRLLLAHGADPNAREAGDNTYPLHWAAAERSLEIARALIDGGGDVHGTGDAHELEVIGWATYFHPSGGAPGDRPEMASFLVERGARHHIFSALSLGHPALVRRVAEADPQALRRRMSRFEDGLTPAHFAIIHNRLDLLDLLIELGADLEAADHRGPTPLETAMARDDREAMRRLHAAGARLPDPDGSGDSLAALAAAGKQTTPMIHVADVGRTLEWYAALGFRETGRYEDGGQAQWASVVFGRAELMFNRTLRPQSGLDVWIYCERDIERIYRAMRSLQLEAARAVLADLPSERRGVEFVQHLYAPPYGGREFGIRDPNGNTLHFLGPPKE